MPIPISAKELKQQVTLVGLLSHLGFEPVRKSGQELFYISMLRESDTKPSLSVNKLQDVWFDHGMGKGGDLLDFGKAYWPLLSFSEVIEKIQEVTGAAPVLPGTFLTNTISPSAKVEKVPNYGIQVIKELGNSLGLTSYLKSRRIWEAAQGRLKEVHYYVEDDMQKRTNYFAVGWQNEVGAWEVRNPYFKGCLGHKAMSFIPGDESELAVFEGYTNYLSWKTLHPNSKQSVLVLNSLSLIEPAIKRSLDYQSVDLFLDRDKAGFDASVKFIGAVSQAKDRSEAYIGFNDFNDQLKEVTKGRPEDEREFIHKQSRMRR